MKVFVFTAKYAGLSEYVYEKIKVKGAADCKEAFELAIQKITRPDLRQLNLDDYWQE